MDLGNRDMVLVTPRLVHETPGKPLKLFRAPEDLFLPLRGVSCPKFLLLLLLAVAHSDQPPGSDSCG